MFDFGCQTHITKIAIELDQIGLCKVHAEWSKSRIASSNFIWFSIIPDAESTFLPGRTMRKWKTPKNNTSNRKKMHWSSHWTKHIVVVSLLHCCWHSMLEFALHCHHRLTMIIALLRRVIIASNLCFYANNWKLFIQRWYYCDVILRNFFFFEWIWMAFHTVRAFFFPHVPTPQPQCMKLMHEYLS